MPLLFTRTTNADFDLRDEGVEHDRPETALVMGVGSAVALAADEINRGHHTAAIIVSVEQEDGTPMLRSVVAVSVSPLLSVDSLPSSEEN